MVTMVDKFGRLVIPKDVRERLGLHPGTALELRESEGEVRIRSVEAGPHLIRQGNVLVIQGVKAPDDLAGVVRLDRLQRIRKITGKR
ncbi:MAG: AbrB/MazE/SpoVT family DNA-binding domain-containing protein [Phycisphaeraceae bacterium]